MSLVSSLCRTLGSINLSLHHSFDLMSSPIDYILKSLDKISRDHCQHLDSFLDINWIHDEKYHPCARWFVLSLTTLMPPLQHKLVRVFVLYLEILATQLMLCSTLEYYHLLCQNVVRISPPLMNSWYSNTSRHLRSFLGPRIVFFNRNTDNWAMTCEFKTSSNPIALKLMVDSSFLDYWLWNHHFNIDHAT